MKHGHHYRLGITPWERYAPIALAFISQHLDKLPTGTLVHGHRALDLGYGRGMYTRALAHRGWEAVGIYIAPAAIDSARRANTPGTTFVVGDTTKLESHKLGTFDLLLAIDCLQGLTAPERQEHRRGMAARSNLGATAVLIEFGATRIRRMIGGSRARKLSRPCAAGTSSPLHPLPAGGSAGR